MNGLREMATAVITLGGRLPSRRNGRLAAWVERVLRSLVPSSEEPIAIKQAEGMVLGGRYRPGEIIGRGGMGAVYAAHDERLGRPVAVKLISVTDAAEDQRATLRARFHREARAAAQIAHPNVVTVYDFGTDDACGLEYLVMELLKGEDLAAWMRGPGASMPDRLQILREAAQGLAAGHRAGLVHRDIKPANIFISQDAAGTRVRVLDFGIARLLAPDATATHLTSLGGAPLTPAYAAPEQFQTSGEASPASDVFSLGRVAFELLTGRRPYSGIDWTHVDPLAPPPVPSVHVLERSVPAHVADVIEAALSYRPEDRPSDADAFAAALSGSITFRPLDRPRPAERELRAPGATELRAKWLRIAPETFRSGNPRRPFTHGWLAFEVLYQAGAEGLSFDEYYRRLLHPTREIQELAEEIPGVPNAYQDLRHIRHDIRLGRVLVDPAPIMERLDEAKLARFETVLVAEVAPGIEEFASDALYLQWLRAHRSAFVLNVQGSKVTLHRAFCTYINRHNNPGALTERGARKLVSESLDALSRWARTEGLSDGIPLPRCRDCLKADTSGGASSQLLVSPVEPDTVFSSFAGFMDAVVLPRRAAHPDNLRLDGQRSGSNKDVIGRFRYAGSIWRVHGDSHYEPLLLAYDAATQEDRSPFVTQATAGGSQSLTLRDDLQRRRNRQHKDMYIYRDQAR